jgi:hypothetical protein
MTFHLKMRAKVMTLITAPFYLAGAGVLIYFSVGIIPWVVRDVVESSSLDLLLIFVSCMLVQSLLFGISIMLVPFILKIGLAFFSYVKASPGGLEVRLWPGAATRCTWSDVERMGKASWGASYHHRFWLNNVEMLEQTAVTRLLAWPMRMQHWGTRRQFTFASFQGWPDGELAKQVRVYAPHLFALEERPANP